MAAKLLHSLADDSADLQKQIGCMNGIFQIFDRHHVLTGRRKSLTLGNGNVNSINIERDSVDTFYQAKDTFQDANNVGNVKEKQRVSTESSRVSFSSSCSSSPSSPELNRGDQPESSAYEQANFPESPPTSDSEMAEGNGFSYLGVDLRDVVRDSMYRDAKGISIKNPMTREAAVRRSRREDSPRPYGLKQSTPADLSESFRFLAKLRETPQRYNEVGAQPRYSVDSHDTLKSKQKLKELPRLSLDSRERVVRNSVDDLKPVKLPESSNGSSSSSNKKRPPSVVAKLMGLETLPGSPVGSRDINKLALNTFDDNNDPFSRSLREKNLNRTIRFSPSSPRSLGKDPSSPRWRNSDFVMKPLSSSRFPIEPAPWKQADRNRAMQKQPVKATQHEVPKFPPTVYSEMERRLNDLEFKDSGKDLRALKQILEAMQSKVYLDTEKQPQPSNLAAQRDYERATSNQEMPSRTRVPSSSSNQVYQSPIVIMKPAKLVEKAGIPASSLIPIHSLSGGLNKIRREKPDDKGASTSSKRVTKDRSPGKGRAESSISSVDKKAESRNVRSSSSKKPQQVSKESSPSKSTGSVSPRLQQKKAEHDKRSRPPTPPSDSTKSRKPLNRQMAESTSPGGKRRPKAQKSLQQNDDQVSQGSNESRTSSHDMCTHSEAEGAIGVEQADGGKSPSVIEAAKAVVSNLMQNKSSPRFSEDGSSANLSLVTLEHPSPISVLDTSIYREMEPSPVKTQGYVVAHDSGDEHYEDQWNPAYSFSETTSSFSPEINRKKLQNVEHLVQKLRRLNSTHDEANQDYIASLCETSDPNTDHRYISEILLASGLLLRDLGSGLTTFQLHPSGHPINPELFFVLEQTKGSSTIHKEESKVLNKEKLNRKLVFDTVNELLVEKLASVEATTNPLMKKSSAKKAMSAQQLLKELCSDIESLQKQARKRSENFLLEEEDDFLKSILAEDVMIRSGNWVDFSGEVSGLVLDVERLVFKDLVNEIVHVETSRLQVKSGRRRTLFAEQ
ncbi:unnamed protein product [Eruca vesicaria subsp. sativa]|uniref:Uncharacterized protein n=1 Tax=Eruca vesicaria subsp. sativa TaxID=29727 RepID=A0ABC8JPT3_ERUVS|nr:unnamed protein product [Eruca vesicaria subsp. sativa]